MKINQVLKVALVVFGIFALTTAASAVSSMMFPDVQEGSWYEDSANWAGETGIITGIDGNFVPDGNVSRAQLATIMHRYDKNMMEKIELMEDKIEMMENDMMDDDIVVEEYDYTDLTPADAKAMIDTNEDLIVIDVSPVFDDGHLPGAVNYPVGDGTLDDTIASLDSEAEYLVYCHSETASRLGAQTLTDAGFTNVYRLVGDYGAWVDAGYPTEM